MSSDVYMGRIEHRFRDDEHASEEVLRVACYKHWVMGRDDPEVAVIDGRIDVAKKYIASLERTKERLGGMKFKDGYYLALCVIPMYRRDGIWRMANPTTSNWRTFTFDADWGLDDSSIPMTFEELRAALPMVKRFD